MGGEGKGNLAQGACFCSLPQSNTKRVKVLRAKSKYCIDEREYLAKKYHYSANQNNSEMNHVKKTETSTPLNEKSISNI